jgi:Tol biopolymer transport system component
MKIISRIIAFLALFSTFISACQTQPTPSAATDKGLIIFASDRDGKENYYTMNPDGKNISKVNFGNLPPNALIDRPVWSPLQKKYFFSANTGDKSEIYAIRADGNGLTNLTNTQNIIVADLAPSPDGKYLAYGSAEIEADIFVMNSDGKNPRNLTKHPGRNANIAWAPDSSLIYFNSNRAGTPNIFSIKVDGSDLTNVTKGRGMDATFSLSPDGKQLVFDTDRSGNIDIFTINTNGENPVNITNDPARDVEPLWSPDGKWIAFKSNRGGGWDIYLTTPDGKTIQQLTDTPDVDELGIGWAPDSQHLIYSTKIGDQSDIFIHGIDGTPPVNITNNPANDYGPGWLKVK